MAAEKGILVSELVILQNCIVQNIPDVDHRYYFFELTDNHILIREGCVKFLVYLPDDPGLCVSPLPGDETVNSDEAGEVRFELFTVFF